MGDPSPTDELAGLRQLLAGLESGGMKIFLNKVDVSQKQIAILQREIAALEGFLARYKSGNRNA